MYKIICFTFLSSILLTASAQSVLPVPLNIKRAFDNQTRSKHGEPGKNYWQNKASYNIDVQFSPENRVVKGHETIVYENNSPDTLKEIVFKLYPNLYSKGAQRLVNIDTS